MARILFTALCIVLGQIYISASTDRIRHVTSCPCSNPSWCNPITTPTLKEVFIFMEKATQDVWMKFDWSKITTVAIVNLDDQQLVCHSHSTGARIVKLVSYPVDDLLDSDKRTAWIQQQVQEVQNRFLDGINIDFEDVIPENSNESQALTSLVRETRVAFAQAIPGSQVTFDIAWSPNHIDGRGYNATGLAEAADFLVVMSYDEQSQIFEPECTAKANSGLPKTSLGIQQFRDLGIEPDKLVLGVPWYGYDYHCVELLPNNTCYIEQVPFRGVNCSDAAGTQISYTQIVKTLNTTRSSGRIWDEQTKTPYFVYWDANNSTHQMWYDDSESLGLKYKYAIDNDLHGVGMWNANFLDYSDSEEGQKERDDMWGALPNYKTDGI